MVGRRIRHVEGHGAGVGRTTVEEGVDAEAVARIGSRCEGLGRIVGESVFEIHVSEIMDDGTIVGEGSVERRRLARRCGAQVYGAGVTDGTGTDDVGSGPDGDGVAAANGDNVACCRQGAG